MEQTLFSSLISQFLQKNYPEFLPVKYYEDGSFECELKSPNGNFGMWIATYNQEITYGLESPDGKTDIHSHISCYDLDDLPFCENLLKEWIESVKNDLTLIYLTDKEVWDWIDGKDLASKEIKGMKTYRQYKWSKP